MTGSTVESQLCVPLPDATLCDAIALMEHALHDLGQPLTSIALAIELMALEQDEAVRQNMLQTARSQCARAISEVAHFRQQTSLLLRAATKNREGLR